MVLSASPPLLSCVPFWFVLTPGLWQQAVLHCHIFTHVLHLALKSVSCQRNCIVSYKACVWQQHECEQSQSFLHYKARIESLGFFFSFSYSQVNIWTVLKKHCFMVTISTLKWKKGQFSFLNIQTKPKVGTDTVYISHGMGERWKDKIPFFGEMTLGHFIWPKPFTVSVQFCFQIYMIPKSLGAWTVTNEVLKCLLSNLSFIIG